MTGRADAYNSHTCMSPLSHLDKTCTCFLPQIITRTDAQTV